VTYFKDIIKGGILRADVFSKTLEQSTGIDKEICRKCAAVGRWQQQMVQINSAMTAKTMCSSRWVRPQQSCNCAMNCVSSFCFTKVETSGNGTSDLTLFTLCVKLHKELHVEGLG